MNSYKLKKRLRDNYTLELNDYVLIDTLLYFHNNPDYGRDGMVRVLPKTICEELFYKGEAKNRSRFLRPIITRLKNVGLLTEHEGEKWILGEEALKLYEEFYSKPAISAIKKKQKINNWLYAEKNNNCSVMVDGVCKGQSSLERCLTVIPAQFKKEIEEVRNFPYGSKEYTEAKSKIPCFTPSCQVNYNTTSSKDNIISINGIICIDIDGSDNNVTPNEMKERLSTLPYIWIVKNSISNTGVFAIIKININGNDLKEVSYEFKQYYKAISEDILRETGLKTDTQCSNVNRLRFFSIDENIYRNKHAITYKIDCHPDKIIKKDSLCPANTLSDYEFKRFVRNIEKIEKEHIQIVHSHEESRSIGRCFANVFAEDGRKYYHIVRAQKPHYDKIKSDERYNEYLADGMSNAYGIGTFYYYFNKYKTPQYT